MVFNAINEGTYEKGTRVRVSREAARKEDKEERPLRWEEDQKKLVSQKLGEDCVLRRKWSTMLNAAKRLIKRKHFKEKMAMPYIFVECFDFWSSQIHYFIPQVISLIHSVNKHH